MGWCCSEIGCKVLSRCVRVYQHHSLYWQKHSDVIIHFFHSAAAALFEVPVKVSVCKNIDKCWAVKPNTVPILWSCAPLAPTQRHGSSENFYLFIELWFMFAWHWTHLATSDQWVIHSHAQLSNHTPTFTVNFWLASFGLNSTNRIY